MTTFMQREKARRLEAIMAPETDEQAEGHRVHMQMLKARDEELARMGVSKSSNKFWGAT